MTLRTRVTLATLTIVATTAMTTAALTVTGAGTASAAPNGGRSADPAPTSAPASPHWVGSWLAAPSDPLGVADANLRPALSIANQTYRVIVTPHLSGSTMRVHLSNRYSPTPITFGSVSAAPHRGGANTGAPVPVTFRGARSVTAAPGADLVSDPLPYSVRHSVRQWEPLALSVYVPTLTTLATQHMNGNATSYYTVPGAGDQTASTSAGAFPLQTTAVPLVSRIDVQASASTRSVVAFGDSITDGFMGGNYLTVAPQDPSAVDANVRYPDFLQRRIDASGRNLSVLNAGISGNRVLSGAFIPPFGPSALARFDADALRVAGVSDVIILEGINDLGIPIGATPDQIIAGMTSLITRAKAAGVRVHLGTILPASDALYDGITAPFANDARLAINRWIRGQRLSASVIDFDAAVRDRANPNVLRRDLASADRLHPNAAGYRAMADAVDLSVFDR